MLKTYLLEIKLLTLGDANTVLKRKVGSVFPTPDVASLLLHKVVLVLFLK